ncbi:MAG TPA: ABC transporter permease [Thermoanaerobaculia bacterium]|nr:ABC transporter permease [Thermoanaerobaculia bacterium]
MGRTARPRGPAVTFANLYLLRELIKRDLVARFTGSTLGFLWAVIQPITLVAVYWFVFTFMIPVRGLQIGGDEYIYFLIAGLLPWLAISEGIVRSMTSMIDNGPVVRKIPMRSELLVMVPNASAIIFEAIAIGVFVVLLMLKRGMPGKLWLLPLALILQFALQFGVALFLAAAYVFFRDLGQLLGFALSIAFYLSPILYPATGRFAEYFAWNPMTPLLGLFRSAMLSAALPEVTSIVFLLAFATAISVAGWLFFRRAQPALIDLI